MISKWLPGRRTDEAGLCTSKGKRILAYKFSGLIKEGFKLGLKGEGIETRLSRDEPKGGKPELRVKSAAQLECMFTNARSMGNKQEELEAINSRKAVM
ncbi:hypothetical protein BTVI_60679 [Pitangus sulphuratus]|nr:hypothetical protein BTVI_60679 [Pitangus sulphuratus]